MQTDIICYGRDLCEYFQNEYPQAFAERQYQIDEPATDISFWARLVDLNNERDA